MKVAVIGLGEHAQRNTLPALVKVDDIDLVAVQSRNYAEANRLAGIYGCQAFETLEELLNVSGADAIYIATPVGSHAEIARVCLNADKHVLVEKVAFSNLIDAEALSKLAKKKNKVLFEGYMYRHHPQFLTLKGLLDSGDFGQVHRLSASFGFPHLPLDNVRYDGVAGGGALLDAAGYTLSASLGLLPGKAELLSSAVGQERSYQVDTRGSAFFLQSGVFIYNEWCFGANYRNQIEIWAERGTILAPRAFSKPESLEAVLEVNQNGNTSLIRCELKNHFVLMFNAFLDACVGSSYTHNQELLQQAIILDDVIRNANHFQYGT